MKLEISAEEARRIALTAKGFNVRQPEQPRVAHVRRVADRLGLFQIDRVSALRWAHYLPAYSRLGPYDQALLERDARGPASAMSISRRLSEPTGAWRRAVRLHASHSQAPRHQASLHRSNVSFSRCAPESGPTEIGQKKPHPSTGLFPSSAVVTKGSPINSHKGRIRESLPGEPRLIHERVER